MDFAELKAKFTRYETWYGNLYSQMDTAEKFYEGTFPIVKPPDVEAIRPATAKDRLDGAVQELITDNPKVRRRRIYHTQGKKEDDDKIEAALQNFLLDAEEYAQTPLLLEAGKWLLLRGMVILAGPFYNMEDDICYFDVYDPKTVYLEPGARPREGFVHIEMTVSELEQLAQESVKLKNFDRGAKKDTDLLTLIQWWGSPKKKGESGEYSCWIKGDDNTLYTEKSGYPYLPLDVIYTGWGRRAVGSKPEQIAASFINPQVQTLLKANAELFTMMHGAAGTGVWGRFKLRQGAGQLPEGFTIAALPNTITQDWPDGLEILEVPGLPQEVAQQWGRLESLLEESLYSRILQGQRQPGVNTATGYTYLTGNARKKFQPPLRLLQAGVSRLLKKVGMLLVYMDNTLNTGQTFTWRGTQLKSSYYDDDFSVEIELMAKDTEQERMDKVTAASLEGKLPRRMLWEQFYGVENYTEQYKEFLADRVMDDPTTIETILAEVGAIRYAQHIKGERNIRGLPNPNAPNAGHDQSMESLKRLAAAYQGAKTGFIPPQPGTLEAMAQTTGQVRKVMQSFGGGQ